MCTCSKNDDVKFRRQILRSHVANRETYSNVTFCVTGVVVVHQHYDDDDDDDDNIL